MFGWRGSRGPEHAAKTLGSQCSQLERSVNEALHGGQSRSAAPASNTKPINSMPAALATSCGESTVAASAARKDSLRAGENCGLPDQLAPGIGVSGSVSDVGRHVGPICTVTVYRRNSYAMQSDVRSHGSGQQRRHGCCVKLLAARPRIPLEGDSHAEIHQRCWDGSRIDI